MKSLSTKWNSLLVFILLLTSFFLGFSFSQYIANNDSSKMLKNNLEKENDLNLEDFWDVYNLVKSNYYEIDNIKKKDIIDWLTSGLIKSLWDKHSEFMTKSEKETFEDTLSWDFEWIWAVVEKTEIWIIIDRILKWSPAKEYWLRDWDIILKANDYILKDMSLFAAVDKIKWPAWTKVLLTIFREGETDLLEIEVIRKKITVPSIEMEKFEDSNIWYISLNIFWDNTSIEFENALQELENKNIEWLIIDLRDNWWGYLQKAVEILSLFIENWKTIVQTKYKDNLLNRNYLSLNDWNTFDKKIVVLINSNSASASEITAWALREYNKAILVWEKTYWKWSVQQPFDLNDWSLLKLTIAKWYTAMWTNIDKDWIMPDIEVFFKEEDYNTSYDRQLEEAKKILKKFTEKKLLQIVVDEENERIKKENEIWTLEDNK